MHPELQRPAGVVGKGRRALRLDVDVLFAPETAAMLVASARIKKAHKMALDPESTQKSARISHEAAKIFEYIRISES